MLGHMRIFALPVGLLALLSSFTGQIQAHELQWPYNLPPNAKYYPEDEIFVRSIERTQQQFSHHAVVGVKKMSDDEGEMFFLDYWTFAPMSDHAGMANQDRRRSDYGGQEWSSSGVNETIVEMVRPPLSLHSNSNKMAVGDVLSRYMRFPILARSTFEKRDFRCPSETSDCASINRPDSCCGEGQTCQLIQDTGLGDVGCCAAGQTCAGSISDCAPGYTSCPNYPGGGCCIPGYACVNGGCLLSSTATVVVTPSPPSQSSAATPTSTIVAAPPTESEPPEPPTSQSTTSTTTTTATTSRVSNNLSCSSGFRSCPASLGGGCCPTNRGCDTDVCPELSSTGTINPPVRPTSDIPTTTSSDALITGCPTGFYACSAVYQGGCCRFGRDCAPTSCPTSDTTTLIDNNSVTIVATTSDGLSANSILTGACATGWSSCAADDGGGCCPTGYACGSSCTASATVSGLEASRIGKLPPNAAAARGIKGGIISLIGTTLAIVIILTI